MAFYTQEARQVNLEQLIDSLKSSPAFMENVTRWETIPARPARLAAFPPEIDARIPAMLRERGVHSLYTHQRQAMDAVLRGENIVVVTPTASGKTMCYNLPVLNSILQNEDTRALYLFPTKALSADQAHELYEMVEALDVPIKAYTYDGDTPAAARRSIRQAGHVVVTNPDMLHAAILPGHTKWVKLFENLKYVVIDEIHAYRGVFGSNLANVVRRLKRLCAFYGSHPQFICCSATIANPKELAETLTGEPMTLIDDNGAPMGERHVVLYNPPVVNRQLGIRRSCLLETRNIASMLVRNDIQSIVFARSRLHVEVLTKYLKDLVRSVLGEADRVRGYRGGYLPTQRRDIERGLRDGRVTAVVATNALELGIDIGRLDACVLCGYPGTIASTWQQAGRAGRRRGTSLTILVASSSALDQYIVNHPDYFFKQSPENALVNPDNLYIQMNHLKCAAFELPFLEGESFGDTDATQAMLSYLGDQGFLRRTGGRWHWSTEEFPAAEISLRSAGDENFMIVDVTDPSNHKIIGEMDRYTVPMLLHEQAIYMHQAQQYQVEKLDFPNKKAYIRKVDVGYYTDADLNVDLRVLDEEKSDTQAMPPRALGEVLVTSMVTLFKKMKFDTHENLGFGPVDLPEMELTTSACWWTLPDSAADGLTQDELQGGMLGISTMLRQIAPLYLMCAPRDIAVLYRTRDPFTRKPAIYLYDNCPGGVGLAEKVYDMLPMLLRSARDAIRECPCEAGCPSCVGPAGEVGASGKKTALLLLERLIG